MQKNITFQNNKRCVTALILCSVVIIGVFIGVVTKLVAESTAADPDEGLRAFRYFTVLSNMFAAFCAALCIPYIIDGLRYHNYHLPRWAVGTLYCGVCCVTVTFTVALFLLSPSQGFEKTMLQKASLYLHLICPVSAMVLFIFINDDHHIPFKQSLFLLIPLLAYELTYWFKVFVIGEDNGGWRDHYYTNVYFPYWVALIALPVFGMILANIIRILHNCRHKIHKHKIFDYYMTSPDFECDNVSAAVVNLAKREKSFDKGGEVIVPRRIITILKNRYQSKLTIEQLCSEYLIAYLKKEG